MAIENIIEKIYSETEEKKRKILEESGKKCREILALCEKKAQKAKCEMLIYSNKKNEEEYSRKILLINLEIKKEQLSEKRKILNEVYSDIFTKLDDLSREDLAKIVSEKIKGNLTGGEEILVSAKYKDNFPTVQNIYPGVNIKFDNIDGIFIIKKGVSEIRFSFEELVCELKEKTEAKLSEILFTD